MYVVLNVVAEAYILQESCNMTAPSFVDHVLQICGDSRGGFTDANRGAGPVLISWGQSSHNMGPEWMGFCVCVTQETNVCHSVYFPSAG
jgi:hypothetical protein